MLRKDVISTQEQWDLLSEKDIPFSRPFLKLTKDDATSCFPNLNLYGPLEGKKVLCLASAGGQQSIAFALLGAKVTVVDFSKEQLLREKIAADTYDLNIRLVNSDMRDLSDLQNNEFDLIFQSYSINYIPKLDELFDEINRVLKKGGIYDLMFHNPFVHGSWKDGCFGNEWKIEELWSKKGYPIWQQYKDGNEIKTVDPYWNFLNSEGENIRIKSPQEYRHTLSTVLNGLISRGFILLLFNEEVGKETNAEIGTWEHYLTVAPPWLYTVFKKQ